MTNPSWPVSRETLGRLDFYPAGDTIPSDNAAQHMNDTMSIRLEPLVRQREAQDALSRAVRPIAAELASERMVQARLAAESIAWTNAEVIDPADSEEPTEELTVEPSEEPTEQMEREAQSAARERHGIHASFRQEIRASMCKDDMPAFISFSEDGDPDASRIVITREGLYIVGWEIDLERCSAPANASLWIQHTDDTFESCFLSHVNARHTGTVLLDLRRGDEVWMTMEFAGKRDSAVISGAGLLVAEMGR